MVGGFAYFSCVAAADIRKHSATSLNLEAFGSFGFHGVESEMHDSIDGCLADEGKSQAIGLSQAAFGLRRCGHRISIRIRASPIGNPVHFAPYMSPFLSRPTGDPAARDPRVW